MNSLQVSEYVSIFVSLSALTIASISDLRTREVSDKVWFAYAPIGLALTVYRLWTTPQSLPFTLISISLSLVIAFALVFFGLAGGADAKALICLGLTLPIPPTVATPILGFAYPFFPLSVLVTTYIASLSVAIWMVGKNLSLLAKLKAGMFTGLEREPTWKKAFALVTGFPTEVSRLRSTFYLYPMEKVAEDDNGARRTFQVYSKADVDRDQVLSEFFESLKKVGSPSMVWVTPGLPLLVFMLIGLLIGLTVGDPLFVGIYLLFGRSPR